MGKKKPTVNLNAGARIVDEGAAEAFLHTGKAMPAEHDAKASKHQAAMAKQRTMVYLTRDVYRAMKVFCAQLEERMPMASFIELAVREKLKREGVDMPKHQDA